MPIQDSVIRYTLLAILAALVVVILLLFNGPIVSQVFDCSTSRPIELPFVVERAAACTRQSLGEEVDPEAVPSLPPPRSPQGAYGGDLASIGGQPWQYDDLCEAGTIFDVGLDEWVEVRMALEFPLSAPPSGAQIRSATLSLYHASGNGLDQLAVLGYAGNGQIDEADAVVTGVPIRFAAGMLGYGDLDVTAGLTPSAVASGWAGFSIRADPPILAGSGSGQYWECVGDVNYPILTVRYDTED